MQPKTQIYAVNIVGIIVLLSAMLGFDITEEQRASLVQVFGLLGTLINMALVSYHSRQSNELTTTVSGNEVTRANPAAKSDQSGFATIRQLWALGAVAVLILLLAILSPLAGAITPPPPVTPSIATVLYSWDHPTTRADGNPLALAEIKETRLYISSLAAFIPVAGPAKTYTYIVPSGQCIRKTDGAQVTSVDAGNLESAGSITVSTAEDVCAGKSLPRPPTNVKATAG